MGNTAATDLFVSLYNDTLY